uniref:Uncharacterized protein n=1 Tax=Daphnia galeata TaxID=27404 RepID=A0A8J2WJR5_9CRUS|nr:unnamed protein product [Daphnia galeata]
MTPREAKFAIRATDLSSWPSSSQSGQGSIDSDSKTIQHWALVVYFPRGEIINLFEAVNDDGKVQPCRAQIAFEDIDIFNKADYIVAIVERVGNSVLQSVFGPLNSNRSSAPSLKVKPVSLQECPEIFDTTLREAQFAIRATDLGNRNSSSSSTGEEPTNSDPKTVQHWALVVYFQRGDIIYLFEAWKDENGQLQAGRAQIAYEDIEIFEKADYIGTAETSPCQLLEIAKRVTTGKYSTLYNNCQTWLTEYLNRLSSTCGSSLSLPINYVIGLIN